MKKAKSPAKAKDASPLSQSSTPNAVIDRRFCWGFFALAIGVALLVLFLWLSGQWRLGTLGSNWIPMAPSTALLLLALASAAWLGQRRPDSAPEYRFGLAVGLSVLAMSLLIGIQILFDVHLPVERWLTNTSETVGQIPVGRMSPLTAVVFLLTSLAFLLELPRGSRCRAARQMAAVLALIALLIGCGIGLSYILHGPLLYGGTVVPMAALTATAFILISLGLLLAAGRDIWPLNLFVSPASEALLARWIIRDLIALALLFMAAIGTTGGLYFKRQQAEVHRIAQETLAAIADLKVDQIANWMKNQHDTARIIFKTHMVWDEIQQFLAEPDDAANSDELLEWMTKFQQNHDYSAVILFDACGAARLAVPADASCLQNHHVDEHVQAALHARDVVFTDLHYGQSNQLIHLTFLIPVGIKSQTGSTRSPQAGQPASSVLLFVVDPHRFLYPLVQNWPMPSPTAETLLIRRDGNEVVFLNNLRHRTNTALALRLPIDPKLRLPAAMAVQGDESVVEGIDYRGIPVLAALRKVPGTPWFMVTKVDQEEIYGPLQKGAWSIGLITGLLLLVVMLGIGLLWRQSTLEFSRLELAERKQAAEALHKSEATIRNKLKAIIEPEGDIGTLELVDIIDTNVLQSIMEEFYQLTGMLGAVLDISGKVLVAVGWQDICTKFHRAYPESCKNCLESDTCLTQGVAPGTSKEYQCKNHMWDVVTPLMIGSQHVGNVFTGQFFYKDETLDVELFRKQARKYGFDETEYIAALEKVPRLSREEAEAGMRFYSKLSAIISMLSFSAIQQSRLLAERQRVEEALRVSEEKLRLIIDTSLIGICTVDPQGNFVMTNLAYEQMLGYSKEELRGLSFFDVIHPEDRLKNKEIFQSMFSLKSTGFFMEKRYLCKDGVTIDVAVNMTRVMDAAEHAIFGTAFVTDISARKQAEAEIHKLNAELEQRVCDRTAELQASNQELEAFTYSVSHDLRAPLRHLTGYSELLQKNDRADLDEKARRHLTFISESAVQMGRLIDDLLAFSRAGRTELHKEPVNLDALVKEVINGLTPDTQGRRILWDLAPMPHANADPVLLRAVLTNLFSNALKFTRPRDEAKIQMGCTQNERETIFFIRDNGVGFDMKYVKKLFGVFQRLHSIEQFEGTGIGLANVRRIIQRHGGRTWVESVLNEGATFYFSLPKLTKNMERKSI